MLSNSCYLTVLFSCHGFCFSLRVNVVRRVLAVIQLKYEQSLICTKCQKSQDLSASCLLMCLCIAVNLS